MGRYSVLLEQQEKPLVDKPTKPQGGKPTKLFVGKTTNRQVSKPTKPLTNKPSKPQVVITTKLLVEKYTTHLSPQSIKEIKRLAVETDRKDYEVVQDAVDAYLRKQGSG
jgi:hypothetical protein